jgi:hypothetical protein
MKESLSQGTAHTEIDGFDSHLPRIKLNWITKVSADAHAPAIKARLIVVEYPDAGAIDLTLPNFSGGTMQFEEGKTYRIQYDTRFVKNAEPFDCVCVRVFPAGYQFSDTEYEKYHHRLPGKGIPPAVTKSVVYILQKKHNGGYVVIPEKGARYIGSVELLS